MKGATRTTSEKEYQDKIAAVGCMACRQDGIFNPWVSLHHIAGRTRPGSHLLVIGLCGPHHQQDDTSGVVAVHPNRARFEQTYGTQQELLDEAKKLAGISAN